jgi:hypothetical protein
MFAMDAGTAADVALWVIFAAAFAFVAFGCRMTRPPPEVAVEEAFPPELDRAA